MIELPFAGGSVSNTLPSREAAYYQVLIPTNTPSWKVRLTSLSGEMMLLVTTNYLANVDSGRSTSGKFVQKAGDEHYVLLPSPGQTNLAPGIYDLAVVSEGLNPTSAVRVGLGNSSFLLETLGAATVTDLGSAGPTDIVVPDTADGGEVRLYQVGLPAGVDGLELSLDNRIGNPVMVARVGLRVPNPGLGTMGSGPGFVSADDYGNEGGYALLAREGNANSLLITLPNVTNGVCTIAIKARGSGAAYANASYNVACARPSASRA